MKHLTHLLIILLLAGCTATPSTPDPEPDPEPAPAPIPIGPKVVLEGIYATSEKTPFYVENIFDEGKDAFWQTMPGAGPDEGLMLYFESPTYIDHMKIEQPGATAVMAFKQIVLYGNGQKLDTFDLANKINIQQELNSLYIRISEEGITKSSTRMINEETSLVQTTFPGTQSIGIANLSLYNTEGDKLYLVPPKTLRGRVRASTTLEPEGSYHAGQLFDSRKDFVWVEGAEGHGEGESLLLQTTSATRFDAIKIWNGYQRSNEHWTKNGRVAKVSIGDGVNSHEYDIRDAGKPQLIKLIEPLTVRELHVNILDVHKGSRYADMVISEMRLYDNEQIMVIKTTERENFKQNLLEQAEGTVLENLLDRRIKNKITEEYDYAYYFDKSIILRSDYSFVVYEYNEIYEVDQEKEEIIAEGNWELLELEPGIAKIKVFGKYINLSELNDFYKGVSNNSVLAIFKDELTINDNEIKGDKFFETFYIQ
ncbi:MAG: hypothetical protein AAF502_20470 [Bacteroidota bacterium]